MSRPRPTLPPEATVRNGSPQSTGHTGRNAAADSVRRLIDLLVSRDIPDDDLVAVARELEGIGERLEMSALPGKRVRTSPDLDGHPQDYFVSGPLAGWANPLALPVDLWAVDVEDGPPEIRGRAIFSLAYEGPPTCVHGGVISLLFDELLGDANLVAGRPGMTGTLTIRYRRPTPLLTELELASRFVSADGRKISTEGTISVDGEITAEAHGLFIEVPPQNMLKIAGSHAERAQGDVADPALRRLIEENDAER